MRDRIVLGVALRIGFFVFLGLAGLALAPSIALAQKQDVQQWTTLQLTHQLTEDWSLGLWSQGRFNDNISRGDHFIINPSTHYRLFPGFKVGVGYRHWVKNDKADENHIQQDLSYALKLGTLAVGNRVRVEQRFTNGIGGVLWRGRYRLHLAQPIRDSRWSVVAWNETFVNVNEKNEGPPHGYEQNRLFGGIGFRFGSHARVVGGYLWRNMNSRNDRSQDDHILSLSLFFDTKGGISPQPTRSESHR